jgi:hypothetical protein
MMCQSNEWLGLLATATVSKGGWVDLGEPIKARADEAFSAVPERAARRRRGPRSAMWEAASQHLRGCVQQFAAFHEEHLDRNGNEGSDRRREPATTSVEYPR